AALVARISAAGTGNVRSDPVTRTGRRDAVISHSAWFKNSVRSLAKEGVDVSHVKTDPKRLTALVVLGIRDLHNFPLIFYRENCADMAVAPEDFDAPFIASAAALLVTGTHFSTAAVDRTSRQAIACAKAVGTKVILDIDYRPVLWGLTGHGLGEERFVAADRVSAHLQSIVPDCDLIVGTEEEIHIAGGSTDTFVALRRLRGLSKAVIVVKRGPQGCTIFTGPIPDDFAAAIDCPGYPVEIYNVLGAGDAFMAGLLRGWLRGTDWETAASYANACGSLVVSRHGCAPAMPSWEELSHYLARADRVKKLHNDLAVARLHRVTTGRKAWPQIMALAFDHRSQFEDLASRHDAGIERIEAFKMLIADAAIAVHGGEGSGAIVDDRFGRGALYRLGDGRCWLARPVERPGIAPLEFEAGIDLSSQLRTWPAGQVAKCLVVYRVDDPPALRDRQEAQLALLQTACHATGHEWLLEVIPSGAKRTERDKDVRAAVERLAGLGLQPDWWKLPPMESAEAWHGVAAIVRRHDSFCHGLLVLGLDSNEAELEIAFAAAAREPLVKGFAVGRHIFWGAAKDWFAGRIDDAEARTIVAARYLRIIGLWKEARKSSGHCSSSP
ncbi:MAG: DUF2090 domain-containing protein, partial [Alphaproteobacteria bacterium]|nr:DUF2090 domain-containing protein [Alphaproteobacteria bacterium]